MKVSVFGLGYVGCVTAASLAKVGHQVIGVDVSEQKVAMVNKGLSPIVEPGLDEVLEVVAGRQLTATQSHQAAIEESDVALVCVGTPSKSNGEVDRRALERVMGEIGAVLAHRPRPCLIVVRSTTLPGTVERYLVPRLAAAGAPLGAGVRLAVNPEFMREGSAMKDVRRPPFTLVGADDPTAVSELRTLFEWVDAPFVATDVRTAEMVKYASNAFHATKICFANEIGALARAFGADAHEVMRIFRTDHLLNLSGAYLTPGFAFGGSCLPKDLRALLHAAREADVSAPLLSAVLPSNAAMVSHAIQAILETRRRRVGLVGLAFKSGTDDLRESPLVAVAEALIGKGCQLRILDGGVALARLVGANRKFIEEEIPHIASLMTTSVEELVDHAEVLVIGRNDDEAAQVVASRRPGQHVIDLTRGGSVLETEADPPATNG
jgi:GDP-mannose 6-dehydrogenase